MAGVPVARQILWNGLPARRYENSSLSVVVLPGRGAKVTSICDATGREWLEQPSLPWADFGHGSDHPPSFLDGDMCGWDECAPTIAPCIVRGTALPDHGELWSQHWREDPDGWLHAQGSSWGYRFSRRVRLDGPNIHLDYRACAADVGFPLLWAAHPQFRAGPGTRVALPNYVTTLFDAETRPRRAVPVDQAGGIDALDAFSSRKLFAGPNPPLNAAGIVHQDGSTLSLAWTGPPNCLGIWFDRRAYARGDVIALEPATAPYDSCEDADRGGEVARLAAFAELTWSVTVSVSVPRAASSGPHGEGRWC